MAASWRADVIPHARNPEHEHTHHSHHRNSNWTIANLPFPDLASTLLSIPSPDCHTTPLRSHVKGARSFFGKYRTEVLGRSLTVLGGRLQWPLYRAPFSAPRLLSFSGDTPCCPATGLALPFHRDARGRPNSPPGAGPIVGSYYAAVDGNGPGGPFAGLEHQYIHCNTALNGFAFSPLPFGSSPTALAYLCSIGGGTGGRINSTADLRSLRFRLALSRARLSRDVSVARPAIQYSSARPLRTAERKTLDLVSLCSNRCWRLGRVEERAGEAVRARGLGARCGEAETALVYARATVRLSRGGSLHGLRRL